MYARGIRLGFVFLDFGIGLKILLINFKKRRNMHFFGVLTFQIGFEKSNVCLIFVGTFFKLDLKNALVQIRNAGKTHVDKTYYKINMLR